MKIFFTSDTHFNHANVIKYCGRPFGSAEEMNREMIERWNAVVGPEDTVYHLGDFVLGKFVEAPMFLRQLNGARKILIRGNHDRGIKQMLAVGFDEVHEKVEWNGWMLQHHPIKTSRKLLCGHIHEKWLRLWAGPSTWAWMSGISRPGRSKSWSTPRNPRKNIRAATAAQCLSVLRTIQATLTVLATKIMGGFSESYLGIQSS